MVLCFLMAWFLSVLGMMGWTEEEPVTGWRKVLQNLVGLLGRTSMFFIGFHSVTYHGRQCTTEEAPILVVAPHTSFLDVFIIALCRGSPLARIENKNTVFMWAPQAIGHTIFVNRSVVDLSKKCILLCLC